MKIWNLLFVLTSFSTYAQSDSSYIDHENKVVTFIKLEKDDKHLYD